MKHVLLIEPNIILAKVQTETLQLARYEVMHVCSGQDAIELADSTTPDVVILELQLAGHNGIAFLQEFRSYTEWQQVPVIIHTVLPVVRFTPEVRAALLRDFGIDKILYKPQTSLQKLLQSVRSSARAV